MSLSIQVVESKATSVPNVFACGDAARAAGSVTLAVADGGVWGAPGFDALTLKSISLVFPNQIGLQPAQKLRKQLLFL